MVEATETGLRAPWGRHALGAEETLDLRAGPLSLRVRSRDGEVWLAHAPGDWTRAGRREGAGPAGPAGTPERLPPGPDSGRAEREWVRWAVPGPTEAIVLTPVFPPRPVVAEPEPSFRLLPRGRARIYVRVPLWVRVDVIDANDEPRSLTEVPTVVLSDTWWGSVTEGELCYWLLTTARRGVPPEVFAPHLTVCPLELSNRSDHELPVERIVLRVAHLSIFADDGRLWADETRVRYQGAAAGSEIDVAGAPPVEASGAVRVAGPRLPPPPRGFRAMAIARLKALHGLTGL